jgi:hypothetical protein
VTARFAIEWDKRAVIDRVYSGKWAANFRCAKLSQGKPSSSTTSFIPTLPPSVLCAVKPRHLPYFDELTDACRRRTERR